MSDRLISPRYLRAGMGDGDGCHFRANIAMSWLAREFHLSCDLLEALMPAYEKQAAQGHPGEGVKPESPIQFGSPSLR